METRAQAPGRRAGLPAAAVLALAAAVAAAGGPPGGAAWAASAAAKEEGEGGRNGPKARLEEWLASHATLRAGFEQSMFDEGGNRLRASRGVMAFHRPHRFRWEYEEPERQLIVADGERVWWYDAELEQVTVWPAARAVAGTPALLFAHPRELDAYFRTAVLPAAEGLERVELVPRGSDAPFRTMRVGLAGGEVRRIEMEDGFGQTTRIDLHGFEYGAALDEALFRFTPPPGTDVVHGQ